MNKCTRCGVSTTNSCGFCLSSDCKPDEPDMINAPPHYAAGDIESIDYIEDQGHGRGFCYGNALKYLARAPHKGCERSDLLKAIWYVERLIAQLGGDVGG